LKKKGKRRGAKGEQDCKTHNDRGHYKGKFKKVWEKTIEGGGTFLLGEDQLGRGGGGMGVDKL